MKALTKSKEDTRTGAFLLLSLTLAIGSPTGQGAEAVGAASARSQPAKGVGGTRIESGDSCEESVEQARELQDIFRIAESFDPLDWENRLAYLSRVARRFTSSEEVARSLFRALGPKPQILSAEFDPVDGHVVRMVTQETVVRTDVALVPIPVWVFEFADALAGEVMPDRAEHALKRVLGSAATDSWTRQAKRALAERRATARAVFSAEQAATRSGWETYTKTCALCHGPDGRGIDRQAPPLAGSDWVLAMETNRLLLVALNGLRGPIKVRGKVFGEKTSACPPLGTTMSHEELAAALTHIRSNRFWGHALPPVSLAEVKAVREATPSRAKPWTAAELLNPSVTVPDANTQPPNAKPSEFE
jgi:mono/diheme cytochrome c family protein